MDKDDGIGCDAIDVAVIGAGPAGLFASECLLARGLRVSLFDRMASAGCKFLVAGSHGGLNITNAAPPDEFAARYGNASELFARILSDFSPDDMKRWLSGLGVRTHVGSGGKVFPEGVSAPEILSRWMARLRSYRSFRFYPGHTLIGFGDGADSRGSACADNGANPRAGGDSRAGGPADNGADSRGSACADNDANPRTGGDSRAGGPADNGADSRGSACADNGANPRDGGDSRAGGPADNGADSRGSACADNGANPRDGGNSANARDVPDFRRTLRFKTASGEIDVFPRAVIFALGGASWPATGSDGKWESFFRASGIEVSGFLPANCGFEADWSGALAEKCDYVPLKNAAMSVRDARGNEKKVRGEAMLTPWGMEGGVVYALGAIIRDDIIRQGSCAAYLDLVPDLSVKAVAERLSSGPGKESLPTFFRKKLSLSGAAFSLLREGASSIGDYSAILRDPESAAALIKRVPVVFRKSRPIGEAISSAGGVGFACVDDRLMLKGFPGWFCAGEMLDWESPTGGFLMQGCFSTAYRAALAAASYLDGAVLIE